MPSDAIPPSLSKTEFIQVRLSHFFKKNATALNVHRVNHMPKEKDELDSSIRKQTERGGVGVGLGVGVNHIASHQNGLCVMSKNLAFNSGKSLTDMLQSLFHKSNANRFPLCLAFKATS